METNMKKDVYQIVTERILEQLEKGVAPWKQNWTNAGIPTNLSTRKQYRGINILLLASLGYGQNYFLTRNQLLEFGGIVKDGEKPAIVVYWKTFDEIPEPGETEEKLKRKPVLRYYSVYNIVQCEGIPEKDIPELPKSFDPIQSCEEIITKMPRRPQIVHNGNIAFYSTGLDFVNMPPREHFVDPQAYYGVLFHELVHATGHSKRINRKELTEAASMNKESYSIEELTAEIGACFLKSITGIDGKHFDNNVAYIQGWLKALKNDNRIIVFASTQAQKAVDYILNTKPEAITKEDNL